MSEPTYIFKNGKVYTFVDGEIVASVVEADFNPDEQGFVDPGHPVQMPDPPADVQHDLSGEGSTCPTCGAESSPEDQFCSQCGEPLAHGGSGDEGGVPGADLYGQEPPVGAQPVAHVVTPNGLKGTVMGRHNLWGEEVTVRFENGVIKHLPVSSVQFEKTAGAGEANGTIEAFDARLAATTDTDAGSLYERQNELEQIKKDARKAFVGGSDADLEALDRITVQANREIREINDALSHIGNEIEQNSQAFASIENLPAVQQASMGGNEATWLDKTLGEMRAAVEATDFKKLMDEGPEVFIAGLDDAQLADAGTVRHMASRWIRSHTAGADEELRDKYDRVWLARVEDTRRQRLSARKEEVRKEASSQESYDGPDDALFL